MSRLRPGTRWNLRGACLRQAPSQPRFCFSGVTLVFPLSVNTSWVCSCRLACLFDYGAWLLSPHQALLGGLPVHRRRAPVTGSARTGGRRRLSPWTAGTGADVDRRRRLSPWYCGDRRRSLLLVACCLTSSSSSWEWVCGIPFAIFWFCFLLTNLRHSSWGTGAVHGGYMHTCMFALATFGVVFRALFGCYHLPFFALTTQAV